MNSLSEQTTSSEKRQRSPDTTSASELPACKRLKTEMERDSDSPSDATHNLQALLRRLSGMGGELSHGLGREKVESLLAGLNESADDSEQLVCLTELCNILSIGTEETLPSGFRSESFAPLLVQCMRRDHNIDIMLLAARALTHLMEALPQSTPMIVAAGAVPVFCEKLLAIEFIDLAEQCLHALDKLSVEHGVTLLKEGALAAMLSYIDFFNISIQRKVVHTAANVCKRVPRQCFPMVLDTLPTLTNFLTYDDSKVVENAVLCFSRLVASFANDEDDDERLQQLVSERLITNLIDLIAPRRDKGATSTSPENKHDIGPVTATMILRTLGLSARASIPLTILMLRAGLVPLLAELLSASISSTSSEPTTSIETRAPGTPPSGSSPATTTFNLSPTLGPSASPNITFASQSQAQTVFMGSGQGTPTQPSSPTQPSPLTQKMTKASSASSEIIQETVSLFNDLLPSIQEGLLTKFDSARGRISSRGVGQPSPREAVLDLSEALSDTPADARMVAIHQHPLARSSMENAWVCDSPERCLSGLTRGASTSHAGITRWRCIAGCDFDLCEKCLENAIALEEDTDMEEDMDEGDIDPDAHESSNSDSAKEKQKQKEKKGKEKKDKEKEKEKEKMQKLKLRSGSARSIESCSKPMSFREKRVVAREKLYGEHPEHLMSIAENVGSLMKVFSTTMHLNTKAKCLAILAKIIHFLPPEPLADVLRSISIAGFLTNLLHSNDSSSVAHALHIAECLMRKLPAVFRVHFIREGVINEISCLAQRESSPQTDGRMVHPQLVQCAKELCTTHFTSVIDGSADGSFCSDIARRLHKIAEDIEAFESKNGDQQEAALRELCSVMASEESVSTYEVITSGIIDSLLQYLTQKSTQKSSSGPYDRVERAGRLVRVLGRTMVMVPSNGGLAAQLQQQSPATNDSGKNSYLQLLVQKLQSALSQEETFPVYVNDYAENNMTSSTLNCLKMLMQPFKLTLVHSPKSKDSESSREESRGTTVMVEPLATIGAIEDFIAQKLLPGGSIDLGSSREPEEDEMDEDPEEYLEDVETAEIPPPPRRFTRSQAREEREKQEREKAAAAAQPASKRGGRTAPASAPTRRPSTSKDKDKDKDKEEEKKDDKKKEKEKDEEKKKDKEKEKKDKSTKGPGRHSSDEKESDKDKDKAKGKESKGKETKESGKPAEPVKLTISLGGNVLHSSMTIFQAVHKHGGWRGSLDDQQLTDAPAHLTSRRMWEMMHSLHFHVVSDPSSPITTTAATSTTSATTTTTSATKTTEESSSSSSKPMETDVDENGHSTTNEAEKTNSNGKYAGLITEGIVNIERAMEDKLESLWKNLTRSKITPSTKSLLLLLRMLHTINSNYISLIDFLQATEDENSEGQTSGGLFNFYPLHEAEFISSKLTNKLLCQVHDPLLLCSGYLSTSWCQALAVECPFLFSFNTRRTFFELSSFGATRAMLTLQEKFHQQGEPMQFKFGRVQKQKIRLSRAHILESAMKVMTLYGSQKAFLEFEFFGEVGTGLGPTLEFYTVVSKALQAAKLNIWRNDMESSKPPRGSPVAGETTEDEEEEYVFAPNGLFPVPMNPSEPSNPELLKLFTFLGQFMGRAMVDKRIVDIPLSVPFLKVLRNQPLRVDDIKAIKPELHVFLVKAWSLVRQKKRIEQNRAKEPPEAVKAKVNALQLDGASIDDLSLDFTLPGYSDIPLKSGGKDTAVTIWNLEEYLDLVVDVMLNSSIAPQMKAFADGFNSIFPIQQMKLFSIIELDEMFCGSAQPITMEQLEAFTICDHGYTSSSRAVRFLFNIIVNMTPHELRKFIMFVTGAPRLPVGGLKNLKPPLTIVRKTPDPSFDAPMQVSDALPSVMTCANYLKLPDYASEETMKDKLYLAMMEGQGSFHLS